MIESWPVLGIVQLIVINIILVVLLGIIGSDNKIARNAVGIISGLGFVYLMVTQTFGRSTPGVGFGSRLFFGGMAESEGSMDYGGYSDTL